MTRRQEREVQAAMKRLAAELLEALVRWGARFQCDDGTEASAAEMAAAMLAVRASLVKGKKAGGQR